MTEHRSNARMTAAIVIILFLITHCGKKPDAGTSPESKKIKIVTTLFPLYDFTKNICQDLADVSLMLPAGAEAHSFEPKPGDVVSLHQAALFIFTSSSMEPWAEEFARSVDNRKLKIVDSSAGITQIREEHSVTHGGKEKVNRPGSGSDPHVWLDFNNAVKMIETIKTALVDADPANKDFYVKNANVYVRKIAALDKKFFSELSGCRKKEFIHGGHYAFGYLAKRYGLRYYSAQGFSPDSEPSAKQLVALTEQVRLSGLKHIFYEELVDPRVARTIANETGALLLQLHGAHNISKADLQKGVTFIDLMERNLVNLRVGLECMK